MVCPPHRDRQREALQANQNCVAFDLPGHEGLGESPKTGASITQQAWSPILSNVSILDRNTPGEINANRKTIISEGKDCDYHGWEPRTRPKHRSQSRQARRAIDLYLQ